MQSIKFLTEDNEQGDKGTISNEALLDAITSEAIANLAELIKSWKINIKSFLEFMNINLFGWNSLAVVVVEISFILNLNNQF